MISWCRTPGTASTMRWAVLSCLSDLSSFARIGLAPLLGRVCGVLNYLKSRGGGVGNGPACSLCPGCSHVMQLGEGQERSHHCCTASHAAILHQILP